MNVLLLFPHYPDSFWSFKHVMRFIARKASVPPLGLITVSAMLPKAWHKKLVDMNVTTLQTNDILWADYVFISAMQIQKESVNRIIEECLKCKTKIVAGGPLFTSEFENYPQIDHFILNEAEITLPLFLNDLDSGQPPQRIYQTKEFADFTLTPAPDYHLLSMKDYVTMNNTDFSMNFVPKMNYQELLQGYKKIIQNIYATKPYYKRIRQFLLNYKRIHTERRKIKFSYLRSFIKTVIIIGIVNKGRGEYWKLLIWTLFRRPRLVVEALTFAVYGYHFRTVYGLRN